MRRALFAVLPLLLSIGLAASGCNCDPTTSACRLVDDANDPPPPEYSVRVWSGDEQVGPAGQFLSEELVGEYRERSVVSSELVPKFVLCHFEIQSGGGTLEGIKESGSLGRTLTGSQIDVDGEGGYCRAKLQLGASPGVNTVALRFRKWPFVELVENFVQFSARGHGPVSKLVVRQGDGQTGEVGQPLSARPRVRLMDANDNPVPGATVVFAAEQGSGTPTGPVPVTTNNSGDATLPEAWVLGSQPGTHYLQAVAVEPDGVSPRQLAGNPARLSATATAPAAARIDIVDGDNQTQTVGLAVLQAPRVRVTSSAGTPVPGVTVDFLPEPTGVVTGASATTDQDGIARPTGWTLGSQPGPYALRATARGSNIANNPVRFTATATAAQTSFTLAKTAGDNQTGTVNSVLAVRPQIRVTGAQGNGVQGITITWSITQGTGSFLPPSSTTDADGYAAVTYLAPTAAGPIALRASSTDMRVSPSSVTFTATATP